MWVDDKTVQWSGGKTGVDYDVFGEGLPTQEDLTPARIGAKGAAVHLQKVRLWRDTYYTVGSGPSDSPSNPDVPDVDFSNPGSWGDKKFPFRTYYVQPEHFLCMGDNSPQSSDGRSWGLVPEHLLLGRAQVIYYPFYFPWWPLNSQVNRVGLIR